MTITAHQYKDGTRYYMAFGIVNGLPVLVEHCDKLGAITAWINRTYELGAQK